MNNRFLLFTASSLCVLGLLNTVSASPTNSLSDSETSEPTKATLTVSSSKKNKRVPTLESSSTRDFSPLRLRNTLKRKTQLTRGIDDWLDDDQGTFSQESHSDRKFKVKNIFKFNFMGWLLKKLYVSAAQKGAFKGNNKYERAVWELRDAPNPL